MTPRTIKNLMVVALAMVAVTVLAAAPAGAIVPPRNCGLMTVKGKDYNIKADALRCPTARKYARRYLRYRKKPAYYRCTRGSSGSKLAFRCTAKRYNPDRTFFAIRR